MHILYYSRKPLYLLVDPIGLVSNCIFLCIFFLRLMALESINADNIFKNIKKNSKSCKIKQKRDIFSLEYVIISEIYYLTNKQLCKVRTFV